MLIDHLERRRAGNDQAMWLAPVLVVTGQAFLLQVLSTDGLGGFARGMVLAAGMAATAAALVTLLRGRAREVEYSEAIAHYTDGVGFPELRSELPRKEPHFEGWWRPLDKWLRRNALHRHVPAAFLFWTFALLLFIGADVAVYCAA
ncbi:MAG: hypothetical protein AABM66_08190 [Actinomycetota bacterium]